MSLTAESTKVRIGYPAMLGGFLMLIDSLWGVIAVLPFSMAHGTEIALAISLVVGLPAYVLDFRSKRRIVIFLPILFLFRWIAAGAISVPFALGEPWRINGLITAAAVLLQWSKLRQQRVS
jgi:hypothetical protein